MTCPWPLLPVTTFYCTSVYMCRRQPRWLSHNDTYGTRRMWIHNSAFDAVVVFLQVKNEFVSIREPHGREGL